MMTSMKRKVAAAMAAVTLMTIGASAAMAEYGDADKDTGDKPRYKVEQQVEVYNSPLHWTTIRKKIVSAKKGEDGKWSYEVDMPGVKISGKNPVLTKTRTVSADDIEAPK